VAGIECDVVLQLYDSRISARWTGSMDEILCIELQFLTINVALLKRRRELLLSVKEENENRNRKTN